MGAYNGSYQSTTVVCLCGSYSAVGVFNRVSYIHSDPYAEHMAMVEKGGEMNNAQKLALMQKWNRIYDAVQKFDDEISTLLDDEDEEEYPEEFGDNSFDEEPDEYRDE